MNSIKSNLRFLFIFLYSILNSCASSSTQNYVNFNIKNIYDSSVSILNNKKKPIGAGTIINNKNNYITVITAAHVVEDFYKKNNVVILYGNKNYLNMSIIKYNKKYDLALLKSINKNFQINSYVNLSKIEPNIGQKVWVIGSPSGFHRTVTFGVISNKIYKKKLLFYRTDAEIFYGNSGGGVFNEGGDLLGIINHTRFIFLNPLCLILEPGANFAVSLDTIKKFLN